MAVEPLGSDALTVPHPLRDDRPCSGQFTFRHQSPCRLIRDRHQLERAGGGVDQIQAGHHSPSPAGSGRAWAGSQWV